MTQDLGRRGAVTSHPCHLLLALPSRCSGFDLDGNHVPSKLTKLNVWQKLTGNKPLRARLNLRVWELMMLAAFLHHFLAAKEEKLNWKLPMPCS